jgi:hypothetical protein
VFETLLALHTNYKAQPKKQAAAKAALVDNFSSKASLLFLPADNTQHSTAKSSTLTHPLVTSQTTIMKLPKQFFFYATIFVVLTLGPLFMWNPWICESDKETFATEAFAEEAKNSNLLFSSCIAILSASVAPLADALFDLLRYCSGMKIPDKSPYTWKNDGTASVAYLAERLAVMIVFNVTVILVLEVTSTGSNYDPTVIYNVIYGSAMLGYILIACLYVTILRTSAESVVTDTVASWTFAIRVAATIGTYFVPCLFIVITYCIQLPTSFPSQCYTGHAIRQSELAP